MGMDEVHGWKNEILDGLINEKIHNRSKPRISCAADNHCAGAQDHERMPGRSLAPKLKSTGSRCKRQASGLKAQAASNKPQAASV